MNGSLRDRLADDQRRGGDDLGDLPSQACLGHHITGPACGAGDREQDLTERATRPLSTASAAAEAYTGAGPVQDGAEPCPTIPLTVSTARPSR